MDSNQTNRRPIPGRKQPDRNGHLPCACGEWVQDEFAFLHVCLGQINLALLLLVG